MIFNPFYTCPKHVSPLDKKINTPLSIIFFGNTVLESYRQIKEKSYVTRPLNSSSRLAYGIKLLPK